MKTLKNPYNSIDKNLELRVVINQSKHTIKDLVSRHLGKIHQIVITKKKNIIESPIGNLPIIWKSKQVLKNDLNLFKILSLCIVKGLYQFLQNQRIIKNHLLLFNCLELNLKLNSLHLPTFL